jgi:hypothetical protein
MCWVFDVPHHKIFKAFLAGRKRIREKVMKCLSSINREFTMPCQFEEEKRTS